MSKIVQSEIDNYYFHYPAGATIVTSHANGRDNAMAVAWHGAVSHHPPLYYVSISPRRFTHQLLVESGEFVVNFMSQEKGELVAMVAGCTGRDVDKVSAFQIAGDRGSRVGALVLTDAHAAYECRVVDRRTYGDHVLFMGEVLAVQWEPSAFSNDGRLNLERASPIVYMGEDRYATAVGDVLLEREALVRAALETAR